MGSYSDRKQKGDAFNDFVNNTEDSDADSRLRKALLMQMLLGLVGLIGNCEQTPMHANTQNLLLRCRFEHENLKGRQSKGIEALLNQHFTSDKNRIDSEYEAYRSDHGKKQLATLPLNEVKALTYDADDPYNAVVPGN